MTAYYAWQRRACTCMRSLLRRSMCNQPSITAYACHVEWAMDGAAHTLCIDTAHMTSTSGRHHARAISNEQFDDVNAVMCAMLADARISNAHRFDMSILDYMLKAHSSLRLHILIIPNQFHRCRFPRCDHKLCLSLSRTTLRISQRTPIHMFRVFI